MRIVVTDAGDPPFAVDATVHEEDTWLALSAPAGVIASSDHPVRVMTGAWRAEPLEPGSVIVRTGNPTRLLAVVHDVDRDPSWRREWVEAALAGVFEEADGRGLRALGLPLLGSVHGNLPAPEFAGMLRNQLLRRRERGAVRWVWLQQPRAGAATLLRAITAPSS